MAKGSLSGEDLIKRYIFWIVTIILIIAALLIIRPFVTALISSFILAFLLKPVYDIIEKKTRPSIAGFISVLIILFIIIIPVVLGIVGIMSQADFFLNTNVDNIGSYLQKNEFLSSLNLERVQEGILSALATGLKASLLSLPSIIISVLIMLLGTYFILTNWRKIALTLREYIPFKDKKRVSDEIAILTKKIVYGYLLIAFIEFIIAFIGFYLSGVKAYLILPLLISVLAFIPGLGPAAVWVPTVIYYIVANQYGTAIGVLITGLIISIVVETILLGKIVGGKSKIHPLILLIGILGGVPIFGLFGFIIGPLILVYVLKLIKEGLNRDK